MARGIYRGIQTRNPPVERRPKRLIIATTITQTAIGATITDMPGLSIAFTVTDYPVEVEVYFPWIVGATSSTAGLSALRDAAGTTMRQALWSIEAAGLFTSHILKEQITVPGAYFRKAALQRTAGTGTATNGANTASIVAHIKATEYEV